MKITVLQKILAVVLLVSAFFPVSLNFGGYALSAAFALLVGVLWATRMVWVAWMPKHWPELSLLSVLCLAAVLRIAVLCFANLEQISDYADFDQYARIVAAGGDWFNPERPPGIAWLAAVCYAAIGYKIIVPLILNTVLALASIAVVWKGAVMIWSRKAANWCALLLALYPEHIVHANYLCSEPGYFLGVNAGLLCYALACAPERRSMRYLLLAGLCLGLSHYFRATAPLALGCLLWVEGWAWAEHKVSFATWWRSNLSRFAVVAAVFMAVISPIIWHNRQRLDIWSLSPYQMGGWSLFLGTNPTYLGNWNAEDVRFFDSLCVAHPPRQGKNPYLYRDRLAKRLALDRFQKHAPAYFLAAIGFKPYCFWGDPSGAFWVNQQFAPGTWANRLAALWLVLWHKCILLAAALALWRSATRYKSSEISWSLAPAIYLDRIYLCMAIVHTLFFLFVETQGRYHNVLLGWLCWWAVKQINKN